MQLLHRHHGVRPRHAYLHVFGADSKVGKVGAGAHPTLPGTGWKQIWSDDTVNFPLSSAMLVAQLHCEPGKETWTDAPSPSTENLPINCINWYVASAFCIWDGGRLPTETEWEYVAANGSDNRLYPWGNTAPNNLTANYSDTDNTPFLPVGSKPAGAGALGHLDLGGSMAEWVFDSFGLIVYAAYANAPCEDCYHTSESGINGGTEPINCLRGGAWTLPASWARSAQRSGFNRYISDPNAGIRCARSVTP